MGTTAIARAKPSGERLFHVQVLEMLRTVMASRRLDLLGGGPGDAATLYGERCWLRLRHYGGGEVTCVLINPKSGAEYELGLLLYLTVQERVTLYLAAYRDCGCLDTTAAHLEAIAAALADRALDGPLSGDFSWHKDYWMLHDEAFTLGEELMPILRRGGGNYMELIRMVKNGDPRWIAEGRKALGFDI